MEERETKKGYTEPKIEKHEKLADIAEGVPIIITPGGGVVGYIPYV